MKPRKIDGAIIAILESAGIDRYYCDHEEDIIYVDELELLGHKLGHRWTKQTDIGIYRGYWFRRFK